MATIRVKAYGPLWEEEAAPRLRRNMIRSVNAGLQFMQGKIKKETPVGATGALRSSIQVNGAKVVKNTGSEAILGFVGTNLIYAKPVELGYGPRVIPKSEIEGGLRLWVERVLRVGKKKSLSVANAIAKSKRGKKTPGQFYFKKGVDKSKKTVRSLVERAFNNWARNHGAGR